MDSTPPLTAQNNAGTAEELVAMIYRAVLRREPDPEGFAAHVSALRRGGTLEDLLKSALNSNEFRDKVYLAVRQGKISPSWVPPKPIPDMELYAPVFSPWEGYGEFAFYYKLAASNTIVSRESCHVLYQLALQALGLKGNFWECGVYKGGTAAMLAEIFSETRMLKSGSACLIRLKECRTPTLTRISISEEILPTPAWPRSSARLGMRIWCLITRVSYRIVSALWNILKSRWLTLTWTSISPYWIAANSFSPG